MSPNWVALGADSFFLSSVLGLVAKDRRSWVVSCALFGGFDALGVLAPALGAAAVPAYLACILLVLLAVGRRLDLLTLALAAAQGADNFVAHGSVLDACASGIVTFTLAAAGFAVGAGLAATARRACARLAAKPANALTTNPRPS
jgi:hypothetical protein